MSDGSERYAQSLADLEAAGRLRDLRALDPAGPLHVRWQGRDLRLFSSNDYLGLSAHPAVRAAAGAAAHEHGMGPRGSALVCGHTEEHAALERELAALKGTEAALLFPTGFQANLSVLSALGGPGVTLFSDRLNHASLIDGCRLAAAAGAAVEIYAHRDSADLARRLHACGAGRKVVVTDSVFSMEGTAAPLSDLAQICDDAGAALVIDEAHATLIRGPRGAGLAAEAGVTGRVDFQVGTLSKAFGAQGGFVACDARRRQWLLNVARPYIFTTALPLPVVAAARAALRTATADETLRDRLRARTGELAEGLGWALDAPIASLVLGEDRAAVAASARLLERGFHVPAIRPPTVPAGTARLRIALSAAHEAEDVAALVAALGEIGPRRSA